MSYKILWLLPAPANEFPALRVVRRITEAAAVLRTAPRFPSSQEMPCNCSVAWISHRVVFFLHCHVIIRKRTLEETIPSFPPRTLNNGKAATVLKTMIATPGLRTFPTRRAAAENDPSES